MKEKIMDSKLKNISFCDFCKKLAVSKDNYTIYRIGFTTTKASYNIGLKKIIDGGLNEYVFNRATHLSTTQIILFRPDILLEYLRLTYNEKDEKVLSTYLYEAKVCTKCFEQIKTEIPEK